MNVSAIKNLKIFENSPKIAQMFWEVQCQWKNFIPMINGTHV